ncbi:hypothetical protein SEA_ALTADENA_75 [Arthrobacter phage Altadena]|uniref:Uncharacterized protein n=1 Tax=Arthrobacter phage Altadena TaxID=3059064 RepID=A0AA96HVD9_9CAUD|nr:hypothetical protein SEA_ALTADENA_75 [Arthrobacter phage Altadena]
MRQLDTYSAVLPDGSTETRQSSRALRLAVVVASTAGVRAAQLEASIAEHKLEAEADLRNDGMRHDSRKEARRVAAVRDAEVVRDVARLEELRALPEETLVEAAVWGWYPTPAGAEKGLAGASTLYPVAEIVSLEILGDTGDTPAEKVGVVFPTEIRDSCPNAEDEPGGTETPTKEHKMAKHINTATVRTAEGNTVELTKTSTHRDYVAVTAVENLATGRQQVLSWHLTEAAAHKYAQSNEAIRISKRGETDETRVVVLPVRNEVKYTKAELAAQAAEAAEAEGVELEVVETARPEVEELPVVVLSGEMTEPAEVEAPAAELVEVPAAAETIVAPVEPAAEVDAPVKWGMGTHAAGDVVISKDGLEWTVIGPAEKGKTVRLERTVDGAVKVRLSFHYNITKK